VLNAVFQMFKMNNLLSQKSADLSIFAGNFQEISALAGIEASPIPVVRVFAIDSIRICQA